MYKEATHNKNLIQLNNCCDKALCFINEMMHKTGAYALLLMYVKSQFLEHGQFITFFNHSSKIFILSNHLLLASTNIMCKYCEA